MSQTVERGRKWNMVKRWFKQGRIMSQTGKQGRVMRQTGSNFEKNVSSNESNMIKLSKRVESWVEQGRIMGQTGSYLESNRVQS